MKVGNKRLTEWETFLSGKNVKFLHFTLSQSVSEDYSVTCLCCEFVGNRDLNEWKKMIERQLAEKVSSLLFLRLYFSFNNIFESHIRHFAKSRLCENELGDQQFFRSDFNQQVRT